MAILKNDPYNSLEEALKDLNNLDKPFEVGKIYIIRYNTNITITGESGIDVLMVVGTGSGYGPSCYNIISEKGVIPVVSIYTSNRIPDINQLLHYQLYLGVSNGKSVLYYRTKNQLIETKVTVPFYVVNLSDGKYYYVTATEIKDLTDFYSKSEVNRLNDNLYRLINECTATCGRLSDRVGVLEKSVLVLRSEVDWLLANGGGGSEEDIPLPPVEDEPGEEIVPDPVITRFYVEGNKTSFSVGETPDITLIWDYSDALEMKLEYSYDSDGELIKVPANFKPISEDNKTITFNGINSDRTYTLTIRNKNGVEATKSIFIDFGLALYLIPCSSKKMDKVFEDLALPVENQEGLLDIVLDLAMKDEDGKLPPATEETIYREQVFKVDLGSATTKKGYVQALIPSEYEISIYYNGNLSSWNSRQLTLGNYSYTFYENLSVITYNSTTLSMSYEFRNPNKK